MSAFAEEFSTRSVSIEQLLVARDERAARQLAALDLFNKPVVSITVVMPGPVKDGALPRRILGAALHELASLTKVRHWRVLSHHVVWQDTGPEALVVVDAEPELLKASTIDLEDQHPLGRLWDLDVIAPGPRLLSRKQLGAPARRCLICDQPAFECGRSRRHSIEDLLGAIHMMADNYERNLSQQAA